jgi:hypothetical protein
MSTSINHINYGAVVKVSRFAPEAPTNRSSSEIFIAGSGLVSPEMISIYFMWPRQFSNAKSVQGKLSGLIIALFDFYRFLWAESGS